MALECQTGDYVACIFLWESYMFVTSEKMDNMYSVCNINIIQQGLRMCEIFTHLIYHNSIQMTLLGGVQIIRKQQIIHCWLFLAKNNAAFFFQHPPKLKYVPMNLPPVVQIWIYLWFTRSSDL